MTYTPEPTGPAFDQAAPPPSVPADLPAWSLADPPAPRRARRRWVWPTLAAVSLAGMAGLSTYLAVVAFQWSDQVDEITAISEDLGAQVAQATVEKDTAVEERSIMETQLEAAKARIVELANEEANANDSESVLIDYVVAMQGCSEQRQEIINVLTDRNYQFQGTTAAAVERETTATCDQIVADFEALKAELGK